MKTPILILTAVIFLLGNPFANSSQPDKETVILSCLSQPAYQNQNLLYSPAFKASWTMLKEDVLGADIRLHQPGQTLFCLNRNPFNPPHNQEWLALSGYIQHGIIDQIQKSLQAEFGITDPDLDQFRGEREGIVCYSYLQTSVTFKYPFPSFEWKFSEEEKTVPVACFGLPKVGEGPDPAEKIRRQVRLFDYRSDDDFILQIPDADSAKEIILAKVPFQENLQSTVANVSGRVQSGYQDELTLLDELMIPKINLSAVQHYAELEGKYLTNPGFTDYFFASACQKISFSMDESGALAQVTGEIIMLKGPHSRILAFDKPFLLILRSIGATEPDLVIWFANADFLVPLTENSVP
ncbi:hypothetical protein ACFLS7_05300 [Bacteroidota bacterium]